MQKRSIIRDRFSLVVLAAVVSLLWYPAAAFGQQEELPDGKKLVDRCVKALGGRETFQKLKTSRVQGKIAMPAVGMKGTLEMIYMAPRRLSVVAKIDGIGEQRQVVDGKTAWEVSPTNSIRLIESDEANRLLEGLDNRLLVHADKIFKSIKTEGTEEIDGELCYKVVMTRNGKEPDPEIAFFSRKTGLMKRLISMRPTGRGKIKVQSEIKNYKEFAGILSAVELDQKLITLGGLVQRVRIETVEYDKKVDEALFEIPEDVREMIEQAENK